VHLKEGVYTRNIISTEKITPQEFPSSYRKQSSTIVGKDCEGLVMC